MENGGKDEKMKRKASVNKHLTVLFFAAFLFQVFLLGYFNLTQLQDHMGYDASSYYLKAIEMAKQGTLFIDNWVDQTTLYFDSSVPMAAFLYTITGNIFFSYGLSNFIVDIGIFAVFYSILSAMKQSNMAKFICLNLIACTYLSPYIDNANGVGYFYSLLSSGSWYGVKVLIILMLLKMTLDIEDGKKNFFFIIVTEIMVFISGISSGWYLEVTIIMPIILFYAIKAIKRNSYKMFFNINTCIMVISSVLVLLGKTVAVTILNFQSKESTMTLIGLTNFWKNLGSIFLGFMELLGVFPYEPSIPALSATGFVYLMCLVIFGFIFFVYSSINF